MKKILTIAASDSGGGAGIQADVKTITALGAHALTAITALTAQNSLCVEAIQPVPPEFVCRQIETVTSDMGADAIKTGMLYSAGIVRAVATALKTLQPAVLVVDPVLRSTAGDSLARDDALEALRTDLLPLASMVTPNIDEAAALADMPVRTRDDMREAARRIHALGPRSVLVTGGHCDGDDCIDVLFDGSTSTEFSGPRVPGTCTHGTGCTLSAALATLLADGTPLYEAVTAAKAFVAEAIRHGRPVGRGHGPVAPAAAVLRNAAVLECTRQLTAACDRLQQARIGFLIPEIQSNFGFALPEATDPQDVLAFPGRIIRFRDTIERLAGPEPGASQHIARVILTVHRHDRRFRAAMNICLSDELIACCRSRGLSVACFDRRQEPPEVKEREGSSLEWGTAQVLAGAAAVPDVVYDRGDIGKEPIARVLGHSPDAVADKIIAIAQEITRPCS